MKDRHDESGVALPLALMAMLVMLVLGALFVAHAVPQQRATARSQAHEGGLHVAESAAEIALASLSDPDQPKQPMEATGAPTDDAAARQWAIDRALSQVTPDCANFERTAGGDGIAVVSSDDGSVYGVGFLPDCQSRTTIRVMRVKYSTKPWESTSFANTFLMGGDIYFDHANSKIGMGGIHANGTIHGAPNVETGAPYTASGSCTSPCLGGQELRDIPSVTARDFWGLRNEPVVNPFNNPFYELCPDGSVQQSPPEAVAPCDGTNEIGKPSTHWSFATTGSGASLKRTWTWGHNSPPPAGQYYAFESNIDYRQNSGTATVTLIAEANPSETASGGGQAGSIRLVNNPAVIPSWPGVFMIADVDAVIEKNVTAHGDTTLVYAREQIWVDFNGKYDRFVFMACDASMGSSTFDPDAELCTSDPSMKSSPTSPVHTTRVTKNAEFNNPASGTAILPSPGVTGVGHWEVL